MHCRMNKIFFKETFLIGLLLSHTNKLQKLMYFPTLFRWASQKGMMNQSAFILRGTSVQFNRQDILQHAVNNLQKWGTSVFQKFSLQQAPSIEDKLYQQFPLKRDNSAIINLKVYDIRHLYYAILYSRDGQVIAWR